jgi:hypothetical protein
MATTLTLAVALYATAHLTTHAVCTRLARIAARTDELRELRADVREMRKAATR